METGYITFTNYPPTILREAFLRRTCRRAEKLAGLDFFESDVRVHVIPSRSLNTFNLN